jgi:hypothetical protein
MSEVNASTSDDGSVDLAEAVASVRRELLRAQNEAVGSDVRFAVGPVELEFAVTVSREAKGEASIKVLSLLSLGAGAGVSSGATNRVKVTLNPLSVDGEPFEVAARRKGRPGG